LAKPISINMRLITLFLLLSSFVCFGQKPPIKFGNIPIEDMKMTVYDKDSSASAVVLADYGESTISYNQTEGFQLFFERIRRIKILTKDGLKWADFSIPLYHDGTADEKVTSLKAVTYNLENGKIVESKAKGEAIIKEKYDDNLNFTKISLPNVKVGSVIEISYKVTSDFLFNFQDWEFQDEIPTLWSEYRVHIPEYYNYQKYMQGYIAIAINESETNPKAILINSKERSDGPTGGTKFDQDKIDYTENSNRWVAQNVPAFKEEPHMTSKTDFISKINFELSSTRSPNGSFKNYMGSWEDINKSYWERYEPEITGNNFLKKQVEEITAGKITSEEKAAAIFQFVRQNFVWDGYKRRYLSSDLKDVFEKKKGNSADINLLLASMMEKAGVQVFPVLVSTRDHGFIRESIPVSSQFNYLICSMKIGEKTILLDATEKLLPFGMLPERCLNDRGLVVSGESPQWVNLQSQTKSRMVISADLKLTDAADLNGNLNVESTGYFSSAARKSFLAKGEAEYIKEFVGTKSWQLAKSNFENAKEIQLPFKEKHALTISEHITSAGNTFYFSPFVIERELENPFKVEKREYPVDFASPFDKLYMAKITVPADYQVDELPKNKILALPGNSCKYLFNATQVGNMISITSSLSFNKSVFNQEEYPALRDFYGQVVAKQAEQIVLKKK